MKVKVDVPATANRKAYSYFRENTESGGQKSPSINKKAVALGAIALGGLAAGGLAIASRNKKEQQRNSEAKTKKALEGLEAKDKDLSDRHSRNMEELDKISKEVDGIGKNSPFAGMSAEDIKKTREGISQARKAVRDFTVGRTPSRKNDPEPFIDVKSVVVKDNSPQAPTPPPLTRLPYNPPAPKVSTGGSAVTASESSKGIDRPVTTSEAKGVGAIVKKAKSLWNEGWDRDYQAKGVSSLKDNEYDVNKVAYKAGQGTRSAAEAVSNFAKSFYNTFVENNNTVNTSAEEVKKPKTQKKIKGITVRALP